MHWKQVLYLQAIFFRILDYVIRNTSGQIEVFLIFIKDCLAGIYS